MKENVRKAAEAMLKFHRFSWEQGTAAQAMFEAGETSVWLEMARDAILHQREDGRLAASESEHGVTDPAASGEVCWRAWELTGDPFYKEGAEKMFRYLKETAPRTEEGILHHIDSYNGTDFSSAQLWVDSAYMAPPFLAVMGELDDAAKQIFGLAKYLEDPETGLMFHIYDAGIGKFVRQKRWATGNGWMLLGITRVIEEARKAERADLVSALQTLGNDILDAMLKYQLPDGRFHDILDEEDSFVDGTSAMMMSAYIYRSVLISRLGPSYLKYADRAFRTVTGTMDESGLIHEVCGSPDFAHQGTSCEAQAAYVMAGIWKEKVDERRM